MTRVVFIKSSQLLDLNGWAQMGEGGSLLEAKSGLEAELHVESLHEGRLPTEEARHLRKQLFVCVCVFFVFFRTPRVAL